MRRVPAPTGSFAMAVAVAIWVALVLIGGVERVTDGRPTFLAILALLCVLDLLVAWRARHGRAGLAILLYVFLRAVAAGGGFIVAALPAYMVAIVAWTPGSRRTASSGSWHPYEPAANAWRGNAVFPRLQQSLAGAHANASVRCLTCGAGLDDPRHAPPDDATGDTSD